MIDPNLPELRKAADHVCSLEMASMRQLLVDAGLLEARADALAAFITACGSITVSEWRELLEIEKENRRLEKKIEATIPPCIEATPSALSTPTSLECPMCGHHLIINFRGMDMKYVYDAIKEKRRREARK